MLWHCLTCCEHNSSYNILWFELCTIAIQKGRGQRAETVGVREGRTTMSTHQHWLIRDILEELVDCDLCIKWNLMDKSAWDSTLPTFLHLSLYYYHTAPVPFTHTQLLSNIHIIIHSLNKHIHTYHTQTLSLSLSLSLSYTHCHTHRHTRTPLSPPLLPLTIKKKLHAAIDSCQLEADDTTSVLILWDLHSETLLPE